MRNENVESGLQDIEEHLSEFAPRRPRTLSASSIGPSRTLTVRRLAAAAAVLLTATASTWFARHQNPPSGLAPVPISVETAAARFDLAQISSIQLTKLAVDNPEKTDRLLLRLPRSKLPRFDRRASVLSILAKE